MGRGAGVLETLPATDPASSTYRTEGYMKPTENADGSPFDRALPLAHVIAEYKFDERADEEESRRELHGYGGTEVPHWDDLNESERLSLARNECNLAIAIQRRCTATASARLEPLDLDGIQERANAALSGPWYTVYSEYADDVSIRQDDGSPRLSGSYVEIAESSQCDDGESPTAEFIAHAREDVPALIAEIRRLRQAGGAV